MSLNEQAHEREFKKYARLRHDREHPGEEYPEEIQKGRALPSRKTLTDMRGHAFVSCTNPPEGAAPPSLPITRFGTEA